MHSSPRTSGKDRNKSIAFNKGSFVVSTAAFTAPCCKCDEAFNRVRALTTILGSPPGSLQSQASRSTYCKARGVSMEPDEVRLLRLLKECGFFGSRPFRASCLGCSARGFLRFQGLGRRVEIPKRGSLPIFLVTYHRRPQAGLANGVQKLFGNP